MVGIAPVFFQNLGSRATVRAAHRLSGQGSGQPPVSVAIRFRGRIQKPPFHHAMLWVGALLGTMGLPATLQASLSPLRHQLESPPEQLEASLSPISGEETVSPLIRAIPASPVSKAFSREVQQAVMAIPYPIRHALIKGGYEVRIARFITDARPELKGRHPRGWPEGMTWDNATALFDKETRQIVVAEFRYADKAQQVVEKNKRPFKSASHELGHAIDKLLGYLSQSNLFHQAYMKDYRNMDPQTRKVFQYYIQVDKDGNPTQMGKEEAAAEVIASLTGDSSHPRAVIHHFFQNTVQLVASKLKEDVPFEVARLFMASDTRKANITRWTLIALIPGQPGEQDPQGFREFHA